jgi:hypothetical protein
LHCQLRHGLAVRVSLGQLLPLSGIERKRAPELGALGLRSVDTGLASVADEGPFELGDAAHDADEQTSVWTLEHGQRADQAAARDANLHLIDPERQVSRAEGARLANVSVRTVASAAKVRDDGVAELQHAVERGEVSVSAAAEVATQPQEAQREIVARGEKGRSIGGAGNRLCGPLASVADLKT